MFNSLDFGLKIYSVHSLSWEKQNKYAYPRPFHALSIRIEGQADFSHGEKTYSVKKNQIIFVPKNYDYTINAYTKERVIVIHFDSQVPFTEIETFSPTNPEPIIALFERINKVYQAQNVGYMQKIYSLFYEILELIQIQSKGQKYSVSTNFDKTIDFINSNFSDAEVTVSTLAKMANISEVYYRKIFKITFGVSPNKYLNALRLNKAKNLLQTGYYTVEQIAYDCGFNDSKYFATCYKKKFGSTPGKAVPKLFKKL